MRILKMAVILGVISLLMGACTKENEPPAGSLIKADSGSSAGTEAKDETVTGTETDTGSSAGTEAKDGTVTGTETDTGSSTGTEAKDESGAVADSETANGTESANGDGQNLPTDPPLENENAGSTTDTGSPTTTEEDDPAGAGDNIDLYRFLCVDEDGNPISGVKLQICTDEMCTMQTSSADGRIEFAGDPQQYSIHVYSCPEGYEPASERDFVTSDTYSEYLIRLRRTY